MLVAYFWYSWLGVGVAVVFCHVYFAWWGRDKRPRVDWEHVYAMERDVWGQTFAHAGAPSPWPRPAPTGISTHYAHNPFSHPIADADHVRQAYVHLTRNEIRSRQLAADYEWEKAKYDY